MNKILLVFAAILILCECSPIKEKQAKQQLGKPQMVVEEKPYSNPALIYGKSAGEFFQTLYRTNSYDLMMKFTAGKTIKQFGRNRILNYYKREFKFDYELGRLSNIYIENDVMYLSYCQSSIYGTRRKVVLPFCRQRDSIKILLKSLDKTPFD